jgi:hypothetical protein
VACRAAFKRCVDHLPGDGIDDVIIGAPYAGNYFRW